jgi:hypothetical protein
MRAGWVLPRRQIETSRDCLVFAIEVLEERNQFIPLDEDACWIGDEQFADGLITRIVRAIPSRQRLLGLLARLELEVMGLVARLFQLFFRQHHSDLFFDFVGANPLFVLTRPRFE